MKVRKAVITAAARGQNALPLQTLVDRDGVQKSALKIILEEAISTAGPHRPRSRCFDEFVELLEDAVEVQHLRRASVDPGEVFVERH